MEAFMRQLGIDPKDYRIRRDKYMPIKSNRQFASFRGASKLCLDRLIFAFTRQLTPHAATDAAIYGILKPRMKPESDLSFVSVTAANILHYYVRQHAGKVRRYLDLGCGKCLITKELAARLEISGHGADVKEEFESSWSDRPKEIDFAYISDKKPLGHAGKWDLITAIMVLHHIPDVEQTIAAIVDALNPGGILILKEHDCFTDTEAMLVDIEHCLYVVQHNDDWQPKLAAQYIKCFNWIEWAYAFRDLTLLHHGPWGYPAESYGLTRKAVLVFRKE